MISRNPLQVVKSALIDGVDRYRSLGGAPEARRLLLAATGTHIGYRFNTIALVALSYSLGDGALGVGGMLAILFLPNLLIQPLAGVVVDRYPGKRLLVMTQVVWAMVAGSFLLLAVFPSIWLLYGLTLAMGIVKTVDSPAFEVRLMLLTPREQRGTANAVQTLAITLGEIVGPLLGGLILALAGAEPLFILHALSFLVLARIVAMLPERVAGATVESEDEAEPGKAVTAPGYRQLLRRSDVRHYACLAFASYLMFLGAVPLFIVRAHDLGMGSGSVGLFFTMMGVGSLLGGIFAGMGTYATRRALGIAGLASVMAAGSMVLFGAAGMLVLAMFALAFAGMMIDTQEIASLTFFQNELPENVYGRFFSLFLMCAGGGGLVGSLAAPLLAEALSTVTAITLLAAPLVLIGVLIAFREGDVRLAIPPFAPHPEPEVVGHRLFRPERTLHDSITQRKVGRLAQRPLMSRLP